MPPARCCIAAALLLLPLLAAFAAVAEATTPLWVVEFEPATGSVQENFARLSHDWGHMLDGPAVMHATYARLAAGGVQLAACALRFSSVAVAAAMGGGTAHTPDYVRRIERDAVVHAAVAPGDLAQTEGVTMALDRIDQRTRAPLDGRYYYDAAAGEGTDVYVVDTGVVREHIEFDVAGGNASRVREAGFSAYHDAHGPRDCNGHGTFVASLAVGGTVGVAKRAHVHSVRVLGCDGRGTITSVLAGLEWIGAQRASFMARHRAGVAVLSLGGAKSAALDAALAALRDTYNVLPVVAAGNGADDACDGSPSGAAAALAIGATTGDDRAASFTAGGRCVAMHAPGVSVRGASYTARTAYATLSGTSASAPLAAGAAALLVAQVTPLADVAADDVAQWLLASTTRRVLAALPTGSPNALLYTRGEPGGTPHAPAAIVSPTPAAGAAATAIAPLSLWAAAAAAAAIIAQ